MEEIKKLADWIQNSTHLVFLEEPEQVQTPELKIFVEKMVFIKKAFMAMLPKKC